MTTTHQRRRISATRRGGTAGLAVGLACAVLALSLPAPAAAADQVKLGNVQKAMATLAKIDGVVGAIGEVYVDGKRVGQGTAGSRLLDGKGGRIPPNSRYRVGSQTKLMTATVLLQLVKEGKLGLDDKLADVLPEMAQQDLVERADEITVQQLIRHTSGIPDFFASGQFDDPFDFTTYYPPIDLVKASRKMPRAGEPGKGFSYSNTNYVLLGLIIEKVAGRTLPAELTRRLFAPLKMSRTYLPTRPPQGIKGPHGHGYYPDATGKPRDVDRQNASLGGAAGGVISTAHDVSAFYRALNQGRLLPPDLQRAMGQPLPNLCGGTVAAVAGNGPGFLAVTFSSADGRRQFAVSTTLKVKNEQAMAIGEAINKAAEAVLCPGQ
ncbi:serine hydrolase domain-containing protein [Nonomuraea sp. NPDC059007]|uniref:serine hydrolase domain-containing protein n=1 Tax=Nonomuraea sp. NPDC059007 TaxID=3346692 RepID=UPI00369382AE